MFLASLAILLTSCLFEPWNFVSVLQSKRFIICLLAIVLFNNIIGYNLQAILVKKYTYTLISFSGLMSPLFAALISWLFLGESVSWIFFLSAAIVFVGLCIFYQEELRLGYIKKKN